MNNTAYSLLKDLAEEVNKQCSASFQARVNKVSDVIIFEMYATYEACLVDYARFYKGADEQVVNEYCNYVRHASLID